MNNVSFKNLTPIRQIQLARAGEPSSPECQFTGMADSILFTADQIHGDLLSQDTEDCDRADEAGKVNLEQHSQHRCGGNKADHHGNLEVVAEGQGFEAYIKRDVAEDGTRSTFAIQNLNLGAGGDGLMQYVEIQEQPNGCLLMVEGACQLAV